MSEGTPHEIVIIKRVSAGHEDEHHGGVWKIAFADFMTAMMAFFLVMWLISANDKTKAVIARYFNPVQLVDSTPQPKGLEDPKSGSPSIMPKAGGPSDVKPRTEKIEEKAEKTDVSKASSDSKAKPASEQAAKHEESTLLNDPYAVLSEIAGRPDEQPVRDKQKVPSAGDKGGAGAVGIKGGEAYRDPFEPLPLPPGAAAADAFSGAVHAADPSSAVIEARAQQPAPQRDHSAAAIAKPDVDAKLPPPAEASLVTTDPQSAALLAKLAGAIAAGAGKAAPAGTLPQLDVRHTGEGTLIDLTDGPAFAMFESASAEPSPRMVRLMARIGRVLKDGKGQITIRGFTDGRPFRSDVYDNWRLSAARAHMAHYMLVRGGMDEQRFERIEGLADRQPKNPKDPFGPENRRIEILVRDVP